MFGTFGAATLPSMRLQRSDITLAAVGALIGLAVAAGYAAWRAVSREGIDTAARWSEFAEAMLFPGTLIMVAITVIVILGWKANIDG
jgi:hypothetical protein